MTQESNSIILFVYIFLSLFVLRMCHLTIRRYRCCGFRMIYSGYGCYPKTKPRN
jgi:hypothetical protein